MGVACTLDKGLGRQVGWFGTFIFPVWQYLGRCAVLMIWTDACNTVFRYPYTRNLIHELLARPNFRLICGFARRGDILSESTFSSVFAEFTEGNLATIVNDVMVQEYLGEELLGHAVLRRDLMAA